MGEIRALEGYRAPPNSWQQSCGAPGPISRQAQNSQMTHNLVCLEGSFERGRDTFSWTCYMA